MTVKTIGGLAVASVKTFFDIAAASVKTINADTWTHGPTFGTLLLDYDDGQTTTTVLTPTANCGTNVDGGNVFFITSSAGKFGSKYISIKINGSHLRDWHAPIPGTNDWRASVGTGDFTFSCWIQPGASYSNGGDSRLFALEEGTNIKFGIGDDTTLRVWLSGTRYTTGASLAAGWKHFAVVRKSGVVSSWYDGARGLNQQADTYDWGALNSFSVGTSAGVDRGYIDLDDVVLFTTASWDPASATITPPTTRLGAGAA